MAPALVQALVQALAIVLTNAPDTPRRPPPALSVQLSVDGRLPDIQPTVAASYPAPNDRPRIHPALEAIISSRPPVAPRAARIPPAADHKSIDQAAAAALVSGRLVFICFCRDDCQPCRIFAELRKNPMVGALLADCETVTVKFSHDMDDAARYIFERDAMGQPRSPLTVPWVAVYHHSLNPHRRRCRPWTPALDPDFFSLELDRAIQLVNQQGNKL